MAAQSKSGGNTISGSTGNDHLNGGAGADALSGMGGNDRINGGSGNDILDGGAGNDIVGGDAGDDLLVYGMGENAGSTDTYDGGSGRDTLQLVMTRAEWQSPAVQADIARYLAFLAEVTNPVNGQANNRNFTFASGLTVSKIENLSVIVDGVAFDPRDEAVTLGDDVMSAGEETASISVDVLANDSVPDLIASLTNTQPAHGSVTLTQTSGAPGAPDTASFVYTPDAAHWQYLAEGETATDTFTYTVTDSDGDERTATVTVTITGSNDAPTLGAAISNGAVVEDGVVSASGAIAFADVDLLDSHAVASEANGDGYLGVFSAVVADDSTGDGEGSVSWNFSVDNAAIQYLAAGETLIQSYTVTVSDGHGGTVEQVVDVTITGTNDAPVITAADSAGGVSETNPVTAPGAPLTPVVSEVEGNDTFDAAQVIDRSLLRVTPNADLGDPSDASLSIVGAVSAPGAQDVYRIDLSAGELLTLDVDFAAGFGSGAFPGYPANFGLDSFVFIYDAAGNLLNFNDDAPLGVGGSGSLASQDSYLQFSPSADGVYYVVIKNWDGDGARSAGPYTLQVSVDSQNLQLTDTGVISFADVDLADVHSVSVAAQGGDYLGELTASVSDASTGDGAGTVQWNFAVANAAVQFLGAGETRTQVYTVGVDDGQGGVATQNVTITITGENDGPVISSAFSLGEVVEGGVESVSGVITFDDVDLIDGHTVSAEPETEGYLGTFTAVINDSATGEGAGEITWVFSATDAELAYLSEGQSLLQRYLITIDDGNGGTTQQLVNVTIVGTNDAPTITSAVSSGAVQEDGAVTASGAIEFADIDLRDGHSVSSTEQGVGYLGVFTATVTDDGFNDGAGSVSWHFEVDNAAIQYLAAGETLTQSYTVTVSDGHGGTVEQVVDVTITGTNDAPVITMADNQGSVAEAEPVTGVPATATPVLADIETNDAFATAQLINRADLRVAPNADLADQADPSITVQGSIATRDDQDVFRIDLQAGETLTLDIDFAGIVPGVGGLDSFIFLYDAAGNVLNLNDDSSTSAGGSGSNNTQDSFLQFVAASGGAYYIVVKDFDQFGQSSAGSYSLQVSVDSQNLQLTDTGSMTFADIDLRDGHTVSVTADSADYLGGLTAVVPDDGANDGAGSVDWTFSVANAAVQFLAAGETRTQTYTVTVDDGQGGVASETVTVTITGENDRPTISTAFSSGQITENVVHAAAGVIAFDDVDLIDGHTVTSAADGAGYLGTFSASVSDTATGAGGGEVAWTFNATDAELQHLAAGQSLLQRYIVTVDDGNGGTTQQLVNITIVGTNDAPTIASAVATGGVTEIADGAAGENATVLGASGSIAFADVDLTDTHAATVTATAAGYIGALTLGGVDQAGSSVGWTFTVDDADLDFLGAGETRTQTYTVAVSDGNGGSVEQVVSVTLTGSNDAPTVVSSSVSHVFSFSDQTNSTHYDGNSSFQEAGFDFDGFYDYPYGYGVDNGGMAYTHGSHNWSVGGSDGAISRVDGATFGIRSFSVANFSANSTATINGYVDGVLVATQTFNVNSQHQTITLDPAFGNVDEVRFDAPPGDYIFLDEIVIGTGVVSANLIELADGAAGEGTTVLSTSGTSAFSDVDLSDVHSATAAAQGSGYVGGLTIDGVDQATNTVQWTFAANDGELDFLAAGQTLTQTYTLTVSDGQGGTISQPVAVTITGTNDAPVANADTATTNEDTAVTFDVRANDTDVDGSSLTVSHINGAPISAGGSVNLADGGRVAMNGNGTLTYTPATNANGAKSFDYTVRDANGGSATATANITVNPVNDAPVGANDVGTAIEAGGVSNGTPGQNATGNVLTNDTDIDSAVLTVSGLRAGAEAGSGSAGTVGAPRAGQFGSLTLNADGSYTYVVNETNAAVQALAAGATLTDTFTYTVRDADGRTDTAQLTLTINGANDAPVAQNVTLQANQLGNGGFDASPNFSGWTVSTATSGLTSVNTSTAVVDRTGNVIAGDGAVAVLQFDGWVPNGFGTGSGPSITSTAFVGQAGDTVRFVYQLSSGGDYAKGTGYIRDAVTGAIVQTIFNYQTPFTGSTGVITQDVVLASSGTYTIDFQVGSYDASGGLYVGARLDLGFAGILRNGVGEDENFTFAASNFTAGATDPDGGALTVVSVGPSANGAVVTLNADGSVLYDPAGHLDFLAAGQQLVDTFEYTISDGQGGFSTATASVTVVGKDDATVVTNAADDQSTDMLSPFSYTLAADAFTDPDSTLTLTATLANGDPLPSWLTFDPATGTFSGVPQGGDVGHLEVKVTASGGAEPVSDVFSLDVNVVDQTFTGTAGNDGLSGDVGADTLIGGDGGDTLTGGAGDDVISGDAQNVAGVQAPPQAPLTATAASYYTASHNLVTGLGGARGFGEQVFARNDDSSLGPIDITSVFGAAGLDFFGNTYTSLFLNNNGNITFNSAFGGYTPSSINAGIGNPLIAAFWTDIDTRNAAGQTSPGGTSQGTNQVYYDLDVVNGVLTFTWDDVGQYSNGTTPNAFQIQLISRGDGDFDIIYRYESVSWGSNARAGYNSGTGTSFEFAESGTGAMLDLENTIGNTGIAGVHVFTVRDGVVSAANNDVLNGGAGADRLIGGLGDDDFVFQAGEADGDVVVDFIGNGAADGDEMIFQGYGTAAQGATFVQLDATHWQINSADGTIHDVITVENGATIHSSDWEFV